MSTREFLSSLRHFRRSQEGESCPDSTLARGWGEVRCGGREWEDLYRRRWQYDKVVRSTHGVNCTGSCSWNVFVKDGIIVWETQKVDYPKVGVDLPAYEPRGCPRGATFSWYVYSPIRVKHPYLRSALLQMWRDALKAHGDPVAAWKSIAHDPEKAGRYRRVRGKGGFVRVSGMPDVSLPLWRAPGFSAAGPGVSFAGPRGMVPSRAPEYQQELSGLAGRVAAASHVYGPFLEMLGQVAFD
jgi:nitrate reductase alpha subunit